MMLENIADPSCKLNDPRVRIVWSYIAQYADIDKENHRFMVKILYEEEAYMSEEQKFVVTAGRDILGKLAPEFAKYNDDILFGEV